MGAGISFSLFAAAAFPFFNVLVVVFFSFVNSLRATSAFLAFMVRTVLAIFSEDL